MIENQLMATNLVQYINFVEELRKRLGMFENYPATAKKMNIICPAQQQLWFEAFARRLGTLGIHASVWNVETMNVGQNEQNSFANSLTVLIDCSYESLPATCQQMLYFEDLLTITYKEQTLHSTFRGEEVSFVIKHLSDAFMPGVFINTMLYLFWVSKQEGAANTTLESLTDKAIHSMKAFLTYADSLMSRLKAFAEEERKKGTFRLDLIGDNDMLASIKAIVHAKRETGSYDVVNYVDSEEWCHVNFFYKDPESISTMFFIRENTPSTQRMYESIEIAKGVGRSVFLVCLSESALEYTASENAVTVPWVPNGLQETSMLTDFILMEHLI